MAYAATSKAASSAGSNPAWSTSYGSVGEPWHIRLVESQLFVGSNPTAATNIGQWSN